MFGHRLTLLGPIKKAFSLFKEPTKGQFTHIHKRNKKKPKIGPEEPIGTMLMSVSRPFYFTNMKPAETSAAAKEAFFINIILFIFTNQK